MRRNEIKTRKRKMKRAMKNRNGTKKKLLYTAAALTALLILSVTILFTVNGGRLFRPVNIFADKYIKQTNTEPDNRDYPGNITEKLEDKLRTLPDNAVVKVYLGHDDTFFNKIPVELSKKDILTMADSDPAISFDLAN